MANFNRKSQDRPIPIDGVAEDKSRFSIIRDNIEILWKRVNSLRSSGETVVTAVSGIVSATQSTPGSTPSPSPYVPFDYDKITYTHNSDREILTATYEKPAGTTLEVLTYAYNSLGELATITTLSGKVITPSYDTTLNTSQSVRT